MRLKVLKITLDFRFCFTVQIPGSAVRSKYLLFHSGGSLDRDSSSYWAFWAAVRDVIIAGRGFVKAFGVAD